MTPDPLPGVFLRKDVILGEFIAGWADPGADREVSRGLVGAITTHGSLKC